MLLGQADAAILKCEGKAKVAYLKAGGSEADFESAKRAGAEGKGADAMTVCVELWVPRIWVWGQHI